MHQFLKFLEYRFQALEGIDKSMKSPKSTHVVSQGNNKLFECKAFKNMEISKRWSFIKENKLCCLCFRKSHFANICKWKMCSIKGCGRKHNKILHENQKNRSKASSALSNTCTGDSSEMVDQSLNLTAHNEQRN